MLLDRFMAGQHFSKIFFWHVYFDFVNCNRHWNCNLPAMVTPMIAETTNTTTAPGLSRVKATMRLKTKCQNELPAQDNASCLASCRGCRANPCFSCHSCIKLAFVSLQDRAVLSGLRDLRYAGKGYNATALSMGNTANKPQDQETPTQLLDKHSPLVPLRFRCSLF